MLRGLRLRECISRSGRDRRRVPFVDELGQKIVRLLSVREARERAVLPFEEQPEKTSTWTKNRA